MSGFAAVAVDHSCHFDLGTFGIIITSFSWADKNLLVIVWYTHNVIYTQALNNCFDNFLKS